MSHPMGFPCNGRALSGERVARSTRRCVAVLVAIAPTWAFACGGDPFDLGADDATAGDSSAEVGRDVSFDVAREGADDRPNDAREGGPSDASADALDATDAEEREAGDGANLDAPSALDAADAADDRPSDAVVEARPPQRCDADAGFACVPGVPVGWTGPVELYVGDAAPPPCGASFGGQVLDGGAGLNVAATTCGCSCDLPTGIQCSAPVETFFATSVTCAATTSCASSTLTPGACTPVDETSACLAGVAGVVMSAPGSTASQGSCNPVLDAGLPSPTWSTQVRACAVSAPPVQADCPAGFVCAPVATAPFQTTLCIQQIGDAGCPSSGYPNRNVAYTGVLDTRACSKCSCSAVTGAACTAAIQQYASTDGGCVGLQVAYGLPVSCAAVQQPADLRLIVTPSGGGCTPSTTAPIGSVVSGPQTTVCCAP